MFVGIMIHGLPPCPVTLVLLPPILEQHEMPLYCTSMKKHIEMFPHIAATMT